MNLQESIRRILREETEPPLYFRRRASAGDIERLVRDVKISIRDGKNKSDALYDAVQNFISSNKEQFKDYLWSINHLSSLLSYVNSRLEDEPLNESILREETSNQESIKNLVSEMGIYHVAKMLGGVENLYKVLGFTGTQEEMIFIVDTLMRHDVPVIENICDFKIKPTQNSLIVYVEIPKYYLNLPKDSFANSSKKTSAYFNIGEIIYKLGNDLVKGHTIQVSIGDC